MPRNVSVIGTRNYTPTSEQVRRIKTFMQWLPLSKASGTIVITPWQNFRDLAKSYGAQTTTALTNPDIDRTYINAAVFNKGNPRPIEWVLAHEAAHLNAPGIGRIQEKHDEQFDDVANDLIKQYNSSQGRAYQAEQSRITSDGGRIQPSPTQVQSALNSPLVIGHEGSSQPQPTPTASIGPRMQ